MFDLSKRFAIVTGGSRGLGKAMAEGLCEHGCAVVLVARRDKWMAPTLSEFKDKGYSVMGLELDISRQDSVDDMMRFFDLHGEHLDILINCAGVAWTEAANVHDLEHWDSVMNINLRGMFLCCQAVYKNMQDQGKGSIINVASIVGAVCTSTNRVMQHAAYSASKAGVVGLTRELATSWGRDGIRVNAIAPGFFNTRMTQGSIQEFNLMVERRAPIPRVGHPNDVKGAAVFLASDASRYVTGHTLVVDGGYSIG